MARIKGLLPISANFEVKYARPFDARSIIPTRAELILTATWQSTDNNVYTYKGMTVTVTDDTTIAYNGLYRLKADDYTILSNWEFVGTNSGARQRKALDLVEAFDPPPTEVLGDRYVLNNIGPVNAAWDGASVNDIVEFNGIEWDAYSPEEGWLVYVDDLDADIQFVDDGTPQWEERKYKSAAGTVTGAIQLRGSDGTLNADDNFTYNNQQLYQSSTTDSDSTTDAWSVNSKAGVTKRYLLSSNKERLAPSSTDTTTAVDGWLIMWTTSAFKRLANFVLATVTYTTWLNAIKEHTPTNTDVLMAGADGLYTAFPSAEDTRLVYEAVDLTANFQLLFDLDAKYEILSLVCKSTANITGLKIGSTLGGDDIVSVTDITANEPTKIPISKAYFSDTAHTDLFVSATNWNSGTLTLKFVFLLNEM
jgi:hypothetical protein